jgi:putative PIN family toxin of toxin-antitoxin system
MAGQFTLVTSEPLLTELAEVLQRPRMARHLQFTTDEVEEIVASMRVIGETVPVTGELRLCRDPNDDAVIETAVAGLVDVLVSGDQDLTRDPTLAEALADRGIRVLTTRQFAAEVGGPTP